MPNRLTYEEVKEFFIKNNCKLLTKDYKNQHQELEYIASCGHTRISVFKNIKYNKQFKCKKCSENKYFRKNNNQIIFMHPKTLQKRIKIMNRLYGMTHKYRNDFTPENYNKTLICWDCKKEKNFKLFPYRKQYADNKEKRCKECNLINHQKRRENHTKEQFIQEMITCCKESAKKRSKTRKECGICTINVNDILELYELQKGICIYNGKKLLFKSNDYDKISIDRIDSNKGYTKDNIQLLTYFSNQAKSNLTNEEYILFIKNCYIHLFQNNNISNISNNSNISFINYEFNKNETIFINKLLKTTKSSAYKRKKQYRLNASIHTITIEDILEIYKKQKGLCVYSGIQLQFINTTNKINMNNLSIDRIDSNKGYTKDNIQLLSFCANQAKSNSSHKYFIEFIKDSYNHLF